MEQQNSHPTSSLIPQIRRDIIRMVAAAKSGHPGGSLSSTDFLTVMYAEFLQQNPRTWRRDGKDMDVFFLSIGHITPLYYSLLARMGYFPTEELATFRKLGSRLQGHPSIEYALPGVHVASGSLGQGLSVACGAALGKRLNKDPHNVYVLLGDGECEEGQVWEAALFAAHNKLNNLTAITDWNRQQIDGPVNRVAGLGDLVAKWESFGWHVIEIDGHNIRSIIDAVNMAKAITNKPCVIIAYTIAGKGVKFMEYDYKWHGVAPNDEQAKSRALHPKRHC